jgi:hypothetical protein
VRAGSPHLFENLHGSIRSVIAAPKKLHERLFDTVHPRRKYDRSGRNPQVCTFISQVGRDLISHSTSRLRDLLVPIRQLCDFKKLPGATPKIFEVLATRINDPGIRRYKPEFVVCQ